MTMRSRHYVAHSIRIGAAALALAIVTVFPAIAIVDVTDATKLPCNTGPAVKSNDQKIRLAMVVGIRHFAANTELKAAASDAGKFYDFIVEDENRTFPRENVCVLTDSEATLAGFKKAFREALIDRADGAEEVVIYYAGHGSRLADNNNDEEDGNDETLFCKTASPPPSRRPGQTSASCAMTNSTDCWRRCPPKRRMSP